MCTGKSAFKARKNQYERDVAQQDVDDRSKSNIWNMKNDQYTINTAENVNAYSRLVGSIQSNFGTEIQSFCKNNESIFKEEVGNIKVNEGDRSTGFGRSQRLSAMYARGSLNANINRGDRQQTEKLNNAYRTLLSQNNQELGNRGFEPIPSVRPAKPVGPSYLDQAIAVASTAASFITPISSVSTALKGLKGVGMAAKVGQSANAFSSLPSKLSFSDAMNVSSSYLGFNINN